MRYQVPQFIEVEDKIFGPLTIKQFLYICGGGFMAFLIYNFLGIFFAIIIGGPILVFFIALALYKPDGVPFISIVENAFKFLVSSKLYIWKRQYKKPTKKAVKEKEDPTLFVPKLSDSKLREITWGLDINENLSSDELGKGINNRI